MNVADPTQSVMATLDGPVLAVLAVAGRPLTVGQIASEAARGSEIGIRRSVARLVEQGIVTATLAGRNRVHELNRDHIAAPIAEALAGLRLELWRRLREELADWAVPAVYACVFGSSARGDGGSTSDIDLLIVHPPFPGDRNPRTAAGYRDIEIDTMTESVVAGRKPRTVVDPEAWYAQVDTLRDVVQRWTGNPAQVVDLSFFQWRSADHAGFLESIQQDAIILTGTKRPAGASEAPSPAKRRK